MRGTYILFMRLPFSMPMIIGGLGKIEFKEGYYAYVGSALGGLEQRLARHLRREKTLHWHIDYLLLRALVYDIMVIEGEEKRECQIASKLAEHLPYVNGFGSSDCNCTSHLFYSTDSSHLLQTVMRALGELGLRPRRWEVG
jgi:Uri superfamily endonuclease